MPRPPKIRLVAADPPTKSFGPRDIPATGHVCITVEEFEAVRLSDHEGLDQETAAAGMGVSRHTYGRLLSKARSMIARALVNGEELRIEGGNFQFCGQEENGVAVVPGEADVVDKKCACKRQLLRQEKLQEVFV